MVQKILSKPVIGRWQMAGAFQAAARLLARCLLPALILAILLPGFASLRAESVAAKNKKGNKLFSQGKYEDAEKAYLDAQVNSPGKPEVIYNLGNSLIKQKKFDQGIQSLRQSTDKGSKKIKEYSWYNTGNALFLASNYKDSVEAYTQALKLNPADKEAKHNLELALRYLEQQKQKQPNGNDQGKQGSEDSNQAQGGQKGKPQQSAKNPNGSGNQKESNKPEMSKTAQAGQRKGSISKEQALQMLDALQSREMSEQRRLQEQRVRMRSNEKDW